MSVSEEDADAAGTEPGPPTGFEWPRETSLALAARLSFVLQALESSRAVSVLDVGCGTGEHLTQYLARALPESRFVGVDTDPETVAFARETFGGVANLSFCEQLPENEKFDAMVASEVLEHVESPEKFLRSLSGMLGDGGILILTVPSGYGCSEMMAFLESLLVVTGILPALRGLKRVLAKRKKDGTACLDTKAASPHINFFTFRKIRRLWEQAGFRLVQYKGRMFLHNFVISMLLERSERLCRINARLGGVLPAWMVSDWMFVLVKTGDAAPETVAPYKRSLYERCRRRLNEKMLERRQR